MDLSTYFQPVRLDEIGFAKGDFYTNIGEVSEIYTGENAFPSLNDYDLVMVGVPDESGAADNAGTKEAPTCIWPIWATSRPVRVSRS